ncbi:MerR family transcriptional regulator [Cytobacillus gottheilii]|uniref:MerR family transcriptional regulator n=1 Tax=Cytobacillus gottheilii TaxID=859144 RepID=UPI0009B98734|nr:MerR family transcriptional regulator [Cytobacillus gottheilii]
MDKGNSFSIGQFSEKTGISIRTLHYYDEIGLLVPEKHPSSGHRIYNHDDLLTLQKIISLKFLGYSLDKITNLLKESRFTVDLNETLTLHLDALEKEKERIHQSITAIQRVIKVLQAEEEIDSTILFTLIHSVQTEQIQADWMERHMLTDIKESLSLKTEDDKAKLDQTYIQLSKEVKELYGQPIDDPKVQNMISAYIKSSFEFLGDDLLEKLANANIEEIDIKELEEMTHNPFTEEEQEWLNLAMEYHMKQAEVE